MKHIFKKIIAVVMATIIFIMSAATVVANAVDNTKKYPTIFVPGFMSTNLVVDTTDPDSDSIWPPSTNHIKEVVKSNVPALLKLATAEDWNGFADSLSDIANELLEVAENDENGDIKGNSGVDFVYPSAESITVDSTTKFRYDWRKDPIEVAKELNNYINYVVESSGCSKVNITCHSLGSVITTSYATMYGTEKINAVVYNAPALYGETYNGELMTGGIGLDGTAIINYLKYAFASSEYDNLIDTLLEALDESGVLDIICSLGNDVIEQIGERVSAKSVVPLFARWTTVWAMIPDEYIDDAMQYIFEDLSEYYDVDYSKLVEKIENYNTLIRPKKTETLNKINDTSSLYVVARYGFSSLPITASFNISSDGVVDTKNASFGATVANYGEVLSEEYLSTVDEKYISPDKTIDASTCLFPEQTWFIDGMGHTINPDSLDAMFETLVYYDGQATVNTFSQYPRFLTYDYANDVIIPDVADEAPLSFIEKILNAIADIIKIFKKLISLIG